MMVIGSQAQIEAYPGGDHAGVAGTSLSSDAMLILWVTFDCELSIDERVNLVFRLVSVLCGHGGTFRNFLLLILEISSLAVWLALSWIITTPSSTKQWKLVLLNYNMHRTILRYIVLQYAIHTPTICLRRYNGCQSATVLSARLLSSLTKRYNVRICSTSLSCWLVDPSPAYSCYRSDGQRQQPFNLDWLSSATEPLGKPML